MDKIFLIEDDQSIIDVYKIAFKSAKINAEFFSWGKEAIEKIKDIQSNKEEKPKIMLIDLVLPDISGLEILKLVKENEKTKDILCFVFSNYTNSEQGEFNGVKPDKFILKTNITPTELVKLVKESINHN